MEGFHADIGSMQAPLQERPELLHDVCVKVSVHIFDGMADHGVLIFVLQSIVGFQFVAKDRGASFDVPELAGELTFAPIANHKSANLVAPPQPCP